jgi:hypothetical protein
LIFGGLLIDDKEIVPVGVFLFALVDFVVEDSKDLLLFFKVKGVYVYFGFAKGGLLIG